ncbi:MAG TPA: hypothetical protein VK184_03605 [Nostocaceae cyanobacterium]|nr:hypothetical protein [Nostocaceae cyanobacterium]
MIKLQQFKVISLLGLTLILSTSLNASPAIARKRCGNTNPVAPSKTTKTLELRKFGIKIKIPTNYRSMLLNDGSVAILDPGSFEAMRCAAPHGFYGFYIQLLPNPNNLSLAELARTKYSSAESGTMKVQNYNFNNTKALLIDFEGGYSSYGIFNVPGKGVIEMSAGCDCPVDRNDIISYLKDAKFIN